ncbi:hypothetical protein, partial [Marinobacter adhaerens]|uniref:hypothetical protein n=1 Tax=Marinobacter adhaerens TaxID=1033846 RepID=UPI003C5673E0
LLICHLSRFQLPDWAGAGGSTACRRPGTGSRPPAVAADRPARDRATGLPASLRDAPGFLLSASC